MPVYKYIAGIYPDTLLLKLYQKSKTAWQWDPQSAGCGARGSHIRHIVCIDASAKVD